MKKSCGIMLAVALILLMVMPIMAGWYKWVLGTYTLERSDRSFITIYEKPDVSSTVLGSVPSGTVVKIIKGNPAVWLIDCEGILGCAMGMGKYSV